MKLRAQLQRTREDCFDFNYCRMPNAGYYKERADEGLERSGKLYEHFLFGDITTGPNSQKYLEAVKKCTEHLRGTAKPGYIPFQEALCIVYEAQRENPRCPQRRFMKDLHDLLSQQLNMSARRNATLSIYSAIGSPLDHLHGIDAVVEFMPYKEEQEVRRVTLDASFRYQEKKEDKAYKADVLVGKLDLEEDPREYKKSLEHISNQIVARLLQK